MTGSAYVHGYSDRESLRLADQANTLTDLLHGDTHYPPGSTVLEAGCGVGAQTVILAARSPAARFTSIDISPLSLQTARQAVQAAGFTNVTFAGADIFNLDWAAASFDHVFVCFVLEHLAQPRAALQHLKRLLKPGGTLTVIEGDHGSAYFYPPDAAASRAIECLVEAQARLGGNALIGRQLYPLLQSVGFTSVRVSPRLVYADASRPRLVEGFTKNTFTAMVAGARPQVFEMGLTDTAAWEAGLRGLDRTAEPDGVFCYTFFKAVAVQ